MIIGDKMDILLLCIKIFFARILDVSLGTYRMMLTVKEKRFSAMIVAFFEVTIWFLVAKEAINKASNNPYIVLAYAGGFAVGTYIGSLISSKIIEGKLKVQVMTKDNNTEIVDKIKNEGFGVSAIPTHNNKLMLLIEVDKNDYNKLKKIIDAYDSTAYISVNEIKYVENGFFKKK